MWLTGYFEMCGEVLVKNVGCDRPCLRVTLLPNVSVAQIDTKQSNLVVMKLQRKQKFFRCTCFLYS